MLKLFIGRLHAIMNKLLLLGYMWEDTLFNISHQQINVTQKYKRTCSTVFKVLSHNAIIFSAQYHMHFEVFIVLSKR